jgi:tRNA dimethylallyltransferase
MYHEFARGTAMPVFIVGPTASGKSAAAMEVAAEFSGTELCCLDKATAWCEMDIGTATPSSDDRTRVAHQLIDIFHMGNVAQWPRPEHQSHNGPFGEYPSNIVGIMSRKARRRLLALENMGIPSVCVGGSGALYDSLFTGYDFPTTHPWSDPKLRDLGARGVVGMRQHLERAGVSVPLTPSVPYLGPRDDPSTLFEQIVEAETRVPTTLGWPNALVVGIDVEPSTLEARIAARTNQMIESGLVKEVLGLVERYGWCMPLRGTVGYAEFRYYSPSAPKHRLDEVIAAINDNTVRYARRQRTWLHQRPEVQWVRSPEEAAETAIHRLHEQRTQPSPNKGRHSEAARTWLQRSLAV